ncbi:leucine-rich repeat-containing protein 4-like [Ornithodoros turicata]|uniref:leucine-rich repeat-containing protein 4-like n=1 Tax=Ornithodoros turicata TaxID=34597 RepID=UPI0031388D56
MLTIAVLVSVGLNAVLGMPGSCPQVCSCKWSGGKQTVECAGAGLSSVPDALAPSTQVLNLTGNVLQRLASREFQRAGLVHLQRIYLSRCGVVQLAKDAFYGLSNLVELDLSHNFLTAPPELPHCVHLRRLLLSANPIHRLEATAFAGLSNLVTLELSGCQLSSLDTAAFRGLTSLAFLRLDGNRLRALPPDIADALPPLHALDLNDNPWKCDCTLRRVRRWMEEHNVPLSAPPMCDAPPRLAGMSWDKLDVDDFACSPEVTALDARVTASEGDNATLRCEVTSEPSAQVRWIWRSRKIGNLSLMSFGRQMYLIREGDSGPIRSSTLTIINVMLKDSGRYLCVAGNRAGTVTANVTLIVRPRSAAELAGLTGAEIGGIVVGLMLVLAILLAAACALALQSRRPERKGLASCCQHKDFQSTKENHVPLRDLLDTKGHDSSEDEADRVQVHDSGNGGYHSDSAAATDCSSPAPLLEKRSTKRATSDANYGGGGSSSSSTEASVKSPAGIVAAVLRGEYRTSKGGSTEDSGVDAVRVSEKLGTARHEQVCATHWKRGNGAVVANPLYLALSPEARDSPDEGLGDEREYETDILD